MPHLDLDQGNRPMADPMNRHWQRWMLLILLAAICGLVLYAGFLIADAPVTRDPADRPPPVTWCDGPDMVYQSWSGDLALRVFDPDCPQPTTGPADTGG